MQKKEKIILIGASDHCKYTMDIVEQEGKFDIYGIIDKKLEKGTFFEGYAVLGYMNELAELIAKKIIIGGIVAIGDNYTRMMVSMEVESLAPGFQFVNAIHPSVIIGKKTQIGTGCVMMAGVIINNHCIIGNHTFIATKASLDHDSTIMNFSSMSPGVTTGGRVVIGKCSSIGIGASILHYKNVGDNSVIGGNALVNADIPDYCVAYGIPAKIIRTRKADDLYL